MNPDGQHETAQVPRTQRERPHDLPSNRSHMSRSLSLLFCIAVTACTEVADPVPTFRGVIAARSLTGADETYRGAILVAADTSCTRQIWFKIWLTTRIARRDGSSISLDSLTVGRAVDVQWSGLVITTCPGGASADAVFLE